MPALAIGQTRDDWLNTRSIARPLFAPDRDRTREGNKPPKEFLSFNPSGFIFGRKFWKYLAKREYQDGHILVIGGAGSGKSSCLAIPSLISWQERIFAIDIKGELYQKTKHKRPCSKVFNPLAPDSFGFNPFYLLSSSRNPAQTAREIALSLVPRPPNLKDPFWIEGAQNILTGAVLHFSNLGYSFIETILAIQGTPILELVSEIHHSPMLEARLYVNQFIGMDIKTLSGIYAELSNRIMIFATDPDIKNCLEKKRTISPFDLEYGFDIFIAIPEDKLDQWKSLLTLIVNQFMKHFERRPDNGATPILFLLDEFPRLGKVEAVNGLATLRSKKIIIALFAQSLAQLDVIYSRENRQVIADNCHYKAILNANDPETQEYFSRAVGTYDRIKQSKSESYQDDQETLHGTGISETTEEKRIMKPEEFGTLKDVVLLSPYGFIRAKKTPYYKSRAFLPYQETKRKTA